jgi:FMN-dependent NADH-azoreductase
MKEKNMQKTVKVLRIDASGRRDQSSTRVLTDNLIDALEDRYSDVDVVRRDLAQGMPHVDQNWIEANFTPDEARNTSHRQQLSYSDGLVDELKAAEVIVIGMPIYNFGVPAALKAWVDMVARARLTFRYTENGPEGLLNGKKAYLVVASGGVAIDSEVDFATPYMRQALRFLGITDIEVVAAAQQNKRGDESISDARAQIADLIHVGNSLAPVKQVA